MKKKKLIIFIVILFVIIMTLYQLQKSSKSNLNRINNEIPANNYPNTQTGDTFQNTQSDNNSANQTPELQQAISQQMKVDQDYADWQESIRVNYPWRKHLPLYSDKYYVYFDLNSQTFIALLYPKPEDNLSQIKADISNQLFNWGINIENYQFEWRVSTQ